MLAACSIGFSVAGQTPPVRRFNIPAQSLARALEAFAEQSGIQILYDAPPDGAMVSPGVRGVMTPVEALTRILIGTGFSARAAGARALVLYRPGRDTTTSVPPPPADVALRGKTITLVLEPLVVLVPPARSVFGSFGLYGSVVQAEVQAALRRDAATRGRKYNIRMGLWIGTSGQIINSRLVTSTGNPALDRAITEVMRRTVMPAAPPRNMPQPVRIRASVS